MGKLISLYQERVKQSIRRDYETVQPRADADGCVRLPSLEAYDAWDHTGRQCPAGIAFESDDVVDYDPWTQRLRGHTDR